MRHLIIGLMATLTFTACTDMADRTDVFDPKDMDGDGVTDGIEDGVVLVQPNTIPSYSEPMVLVHMSRIHAFPSLAPGSLCSVGYGLEGSVDDWWSACNPSQVLALDNDGDDVSNNDYVAFRLWEGDTSFCLNIRSASCTDPDAPDADSFQCWSDLVDDRTDDAVVGVNPTDRDDADIVYAIGVSVRQTAQGDELAYVVEPEPDACLGL